MANLTLRSVKGSPLTNAEVDANFSSLDNAKLELSGGTMTGPITFAGGQSFAASQLSGTVAVANGGTGASTESGARTNLGATTIGGNLFTLTNPGAITFPRFNADNTVSALSAADFRTAIGSATGTVTSVSGTGSVNGITLSGTVTESGSLTLGGSLSNVSLSTQVTGTLPVANGGTGQTTVQAAINSLAGAVTSGQYLRGNGTNVVMSAIQAADVPTLNQNTTGTASNVTGTVAIANGGTGATTNTAARTNLGATTIGSNLFTLTNPGAVTFPRFNADNTVSSLNAADFRTAIGAGTSSTTGTVTSVATGTGLTGGPITSSGTISLANTAVTAGSYTNANITVDAQGRITAASSGASGGVTSFSAGTTGLTPSTGTTGAVTLDGTLAVANGGTGATTNTAARTNLGATTVGSNLFTLTNPSAITFLQINANNTVSALSAASFRSAIGAGTGNGNGTVTSVSGTGYVNGLSLSGNVTSSGSITLGGGIGDLTGTNITYPLLFGPYEWKQDLVSSGTATMNQHTTSVFYLTPTGDVILGQNFLNLHGSNAQKFFILVITNGGAYNITWLPNTKWVDATPPTLTASGTDVIGFLSNNNGNDIKGFVVGLNVS